MGTVLAVNAPQTLYVSIRRDELRQLKDDNEELQRQVAELTMMLVQARQQSLQGPARAQLA